VKDSSIFLEVQWTDSVGFLELSVRDFSAENIHGIEDLQFSLNPQSMRRGDLNNDSKEILCYSIPMSCPMNYRKNDGVVLCDQNSLLNLFFHSFETNLI
jgi:hypothetical protein